MTIHTITMLAPQSRPSVWRPGGGRIEPWYTSVGYEVSSHTDKGRRSISLEFCEKIITKIASTILAAVGVI